MGQLLQFTARSGFRKESKMITDADIQAAEVYGRVESRLADAAHRLDQILELVTADARDEDGRYWGECEDVQAALEQAVNDMAQACADYQNYKRASGALEITPPKE